MSAIDIGIVVFLLALALSGLWIMFDGVKIERLQKELDETKGKLAALEGRHTLQQQMVPLQGAK